MGLKHHPIENLAHACSCNSGGMTEEGHAHLLEMAKEVVAWAARLDVVLQTPLLERAAELKKEQK